MNFTAGFSFTQLLYLHTGHTESTRIPPVLLQFQLCRKLTRSQGLVNTSKVKLDSQKAPVIWANPAWVVTYTNVTYREMWPSLGFLTTSVWNLPTPKELLRENKPNSSMWVRLMPRLMGTRWTQADGEQKAPFTVLFTVSGKWNSSFFLFLNYALIYKSKARTENIE